MKSLLKEKILLEEPEDEVKDLPDAQPEEPIVVSTEPEIEPTVNKDAFVNILSSELSNTYNNIADLKSIVVTLTTDLPERTDVIDIVNELIDERTIHVGMIQKAIDLLDAKHADLVDTGVEVATNIAEEPEANDLTDK